MGKPEVIQNGVGLLTPALVDHAGRRGIGDLLREPPRQPETERVLAHKDMRRTGHGGGLVPVEPCQQGQRLAGPKMLPGQLDMARFQALVAPMVDDGSRPLIRRQDAVADRRSLTVEQRTHRCRCPSDR